MKRALVAVGFALLVAAAVVMLLGGPGEPDAPPLAVAGDADLQAPGRAAPERIVPPAAVVELPEGALEPIIGDPRPDDVRFCDEALWQGAAPLLVDLRPPGEVVVDEVAWQGYGASARAGIASWISKCHFADGPVALRGDISGSVLGRYAEDIGYMEEKRELPAQRAENP